MRLNAKLILFVVLLDSVYQSNAQIEHEDYPVIGKKAPDFILSQIQYFDMSTASNTSLSGKPIILDFFSFGCSACFASFPKVNELNSKFKSQVNIILIGKEHEKIRTAYEEFRKKLKLDLPVAYEDKLLTQWKIFGFPRVVWIDAHGVVQAVTDTRQLDAENIEALIDGRPFTFKIDYSYKEKSLTILKPLLIEDNGGSEKDFRFRSVLYPWDPTTSQQTPGSLTNLLGNPQTRKNINMNFYGVQCTGASLWQLYVLAYLGDEPYRDGSGNWYNAPILELSDPSEFQHDFSTGRNVYNYSIIVPEDMGSVEYIMRLMQQDLERYLGFSAGLEKRMAPYWKLTVKEQFRQKLKTKKPQISPTVEGTYAGKQYKNVNIKLVSRDLSELDPQGLAVIDETGIDFNIDLELNADMTNMGAVWQELEKHGLKLERAKKEMTALVIRDANNIYKKKQAEQ